jgi:thiamine biosynthesis protein ThiS
MNEANAAVQIVVNGDRRSVPRGLYVSGLLVHLGITANRVAIERNSDILPRAAWDKTTVSAGDRFEIVHLVGGGSLGAAKG